MRGGNGVRPRPEGARRDFVREKLKNDLTWRLIERWQPYALNQAIARLLSQALEDINGARPEFRSEERQKPTKGAINRHNETRSDFRASVGEFVRSFPENEAATARERVIEDVSQEVAEVITLNRINTFRVNGIPLSECTAREALSWCDKQERDVEFVRRICAGIPPEDTIGRWFSKAAEEIENIWISVNSPEAWERRRTIRDNMHSAWAAAVMFATYPEATEELHALEQRIAKAHTGGDMPWREGLHTAVPFVETYVRAHPAGPPA